jgi:plastocyanin
MRATSVLVTCVVVGATTLTGCGATSPGPSAAAISDFTPVRAPAAPVADVTISNFAYAVRAPLKPGQLVTVVNDDGANHSLAANVDDVFDVRVSGGGGIESFTAPMTPGVYAFHCKYHANMQGTLTVQ